MSDMRTTGQSGRALCAARRQMQQAAAVPQSRGLDTLSTGNCDIIPAVEITQDDTCVARDTV